MALEEPGGYNPWRPLVDGKSVELVRMGGSVVDIDPLVDLTDDNGWECDGCVEGSPDVRPYADWGGP